MKSKMFSFITSTYNPLGGECENSCSYCWAKNLIKKYDMKKYHGSPYLVEKALNCKFKPGDYVFVQDMTDLFADNVHSCIIESVLNHLRHFPKTKFLLLTKNPSRYLMVLRDIPENCIIGATIETNGWTLDKGDFYTETHISDASNPYLRLHALYNVKLELGKSHEFMVCIEPILDFGLDIFLDRLKLLRPDFVVVGYDNYNNQMPEPILAKTESLIKGLEQFTKVHRKTVRKAWDEV